MRDDRSHPLSPARPDSHRIGDELLAGYVSGALPEAFGLVVAAQASLDAETRARLDALEAIGGVLLDAGETAEMAPGSLEASAALSVARLWTGSGRTARTSTPECPPSSSRWPKKRGPKSSKGSFWGFIMRCSIRSCS